MHESEDDPQPTPTHLDHPYASVVSQQSMFFFANYSPLVCVSVQPSVWNDISVTSSDMNLIIWGIMMGYGLGMMPVIFLKLFYLFCHL